MKGNLIETPKSIRGIHYDLGDIVVIEESRTGLKFDARLDAIHEHIEGSKPQTQEVTSQQTVGYTRSIL
jgi:hypothetical protein